MHSFSVLVCCPCTSQSISVALHRRTVAHWHVLYLARIVSSVLFVTLQINNTIPTRGISSYCWTASAHSPVTRQNTHSPLNTLLPHLHKLNTVIATWEPSLPILQQPLIWNCDTLPTQTPLPSHFPSWSSLSFSRHSIDICLLLPSPCYFDDLLCHSLPNTLSLIARRNTSVFALLGR